MRVTMMFFAAMGLSVWGGCSSESESIPVAVAELEPKSEVQQVSEFGPVLEWCNRIKDHDFEGASQLVIEPSRFYQSEEGDWVISWPGDEEDPEWTIRAPEAVWMSRMARVELKSSKIDLSPDQEDVDCKFLATGVMCDHLSMVARFVPKDEGVLIVIDPIGAASDFTLK